MVLFAGPGLAVAAAATSTEISRAASARTSAAKATCQLLHRTPASVDGWMGLSSEAQDAARRRTSPVAG
jgi:hypothetical protein